MGKWRAHVVLVPGTGPGHSIPFFDLATRIASRAVKVTILSTQTHVWKVWSDAIYRRWAPRMRAGEDIELVPVNDGIDDGTLESFFTFVQESSEAKLIAAFAAHLSSLMSSVTTVPRPCCIISDMLMGWTQPLAAKFSIPRYILHIQPATNLSLMLHLPTLIAEGRLPLTEDNQTESMEIPGFRDPVHPSDLHEDLIDPRQIKWGSFDLYLRMSRRAREAPIILVNSFREFEEDVFAALDDLHSQAPTHRQGPRVIPVGPLLLPADFPSPVTVMEEELSEESTRLMQWLDMQPPRSVLFIAFGTLVSNAAEQIHEIAYGLEASEQPFLWAAGRPIYEKQPSPQVLPPGFEERMRDRGKVATFVVPQLRILRHPACGAFLNHCGWNTVQESISGGVPLIAWPRQFEQRMTARFLIDTVKVAAELAEVRRGLVARDEIERVVRLVMQGEEGEALRSRAGELKRCAARYAYSNPNLDTFLAEIIPTNPTDDKPCINP